MTFPIPPLLGRFRRVVFAVALVAAISAQAHAKDSGLRSPGHRTIYKPHETFGQALDQNRRRFVAEVAAGMAPEGNLALLLGGLNFPLDGLDLYAGIGFELSPARLYTGSMRYTLAVGGLRPYINVGYLFKDTFAVGAFSHNVFAELGHRWLLHKTYHLMLGAGLRRILQTSLKGNSPLRNESVDPVLLNETLNSIDPWAVTATVRFSRAF